MPICTASFWAAFGQESPGLQALLEQILCAVSNKSYASLAISGHSLELTAWRKQCLRCEQVRIPLYGCDCYAYGLLSAGFCDLVIEADMKPYDYLALVPIVEGAGGIMTDWEVTSTFFSGDAHQYFRGICNKVFSVCLQRAPGRHVLNMAC